MTGTAPGTRKAPGTRLYTMRMRVGDSDSEFRYFHRVSTVGGTVRDVAAGTRKSPGSRVHGSRYTVRVGDPGSFFF